MAKKTTAGKRSSGRTKSTETVEDAEIVNNETATSDTVEETTVEEDLTDAKNADAAEQIDPAPSEDRGVSNDDEEALSDTVTDGSEPKPEDEANESAAPEGSADDPGDEDTPVVAEDEQQETADAAAEHNDENAGSDDIAAEVEKLVSEPVKEEAPAPAPSPSQPQDSQSSNPVALVFGGVVAGAIGFFAAYIGIGVNPPPPPEPVDLAPIEQSIDAQTQRLDALEASAADVAAPDLSGLEAEIAGLSTAIAALDARIVAVESREPGTSGSVDPSLIEDLAELKSTIAALQDENEAAKANARSAAADTLKRAALTNIRIGIDTGAPYAAGVAELEQLGVNVPPELSESAPSGVMALSSLQEAFPEAARAALAADRAEAAANGETGGFGDFLRSQLGARSLTPQEGDGTDAVLSRVEAALKEGRLDDVLTELDTLPDVAQPAMTDWLSLVKARATAIAAAQSLSDSLN